MAGGSLAPALRRNSFDHAPSKLRRLAVWAAISTLIQSALWIALCSTAQVVYNGLLEVPDWRPQDESQKTPPLERFPRLLANLYFKESPMPRLPDDGLMLPSDMILWMQIMTVSSALWFVTSAGVIAAMNLASMEAGCFWAYLWVAMTGIQTVLDIMLGALAARDLVLLVTWSDLETFPGESTALLLCPVLVLGVALRGVVLLVINVVSMLRVARRVAEQRTRFKQASRPSDRTYRASTVEQGAPIDAFLYKNSGHLDDGIGARNPAFEADVDRWSSFRPPPGHRDRVPLNRDDDEDDFTQHLSWMAEVDKHVNGSNKNNGQPTRQSGRPSSLEALDSRESKIELRRPPGRHLERQISVDESEQITHFREPEPLPPAPAAPAQLQVRTQTVQLPRVAPVFIPQPDYTPPMARSQKFSK